jgi:hypothetical protein
MKRLGITINFIRKLKPINSIMGVLKGGHIGSGGGRIGMTDDQMTHFRELLSQAVQDINTESGFTAEDKRDLIKNLPGMSDKNHNFYDFLNSQYRNPHAIKVQVAIMTRKETATTRGRLKAKRTSKK